MALPISKSLTSKDKKSKKETQRDSSSGEDNIYEVEKIVGMTNVEGQTFYRVRWLGFSAQDDTLEPYENLKTCKHVIDEFLERQKKKKRKAVNSAHKPVRKKCSSQSMTDLFHNLSDEAATTQNTKQIESSVTKETKSKGNNNQKGLVDSPQYIMDMFSASTNQNTHLHSKPKVKSGSNTLIATKKTNSKAKSTVESSSSTGVSVHSVPTSKSLVSFPSSYVSAVDQSSDTELIGEPRVARSNVCDASSSNRPHKSISFSQHPPQELLSQQQMLKSDTHHCQKGLTSPNSLVRSPSVSSALPSELCHKIQKPFERITDTVSQQHSEIEASTVSSSIPKESSQESPEHNNPADKKKVINEILDKCVRSGDFDKVKEIVENHKDCDLEWPSNSGTTLLMRAAVMGHHAISELLIMNGADLNAKHSSGVTALISAATNGHFYILSLLLSLGAHMDVRAPSSGTTALIEATKRGDNHMIRELLEYGANFSIKDNSQMTALDHAKKLKNGIAEKILTNHIERVITSFEAKVNATISNTAQLLCPLFPIHCLALNESTSFVIYFDHKFEHCPPGAGMLLFIAHALVKGHADIKCRLHGACAVNSVYLNNKQQLSLTEDGNYILSFSPIRDGRNKLEIKTFNSPTTEVKLLVCAYKAQLCVPD